LRAIGLNQPGVAPEASSKSCHSTRHGTQVALTEVFGVQKLLWKNTMLKRSIQPILKPLTKPPMAGLAGPDRRISSPGSTSGPFVFENSSGEIHVALTSKIFDDEILDGRLNSM
jgi:hypothetical protein